MQIRTIILGFGLLLFGGCVTKTTEVHSDSENPNQKPATAIHFTYKEHDYIKFQWYCIMMVMILNVVMFMIQIVGNVKKKIESLINEPSFIFF